MAAYQGKLKAWGRTPAYMGKSNCPDNAMAESFFSTLRSTCFYWVKARDNSKLKDGTDENRPYYNHERIA
jgi:putative transposase